MAITEDMELLVKRSPYTTLMKQYGVELLMKHLVGWTVNRKNKYLKKDINFLDYMTLSNIKILEVNVTKYEAGHIDVHPQGIGNSHNAQKQIFGVLYKDNEYFHKYQ
uniref:Cilia- and flagella-associated protein 299 n=1 Tax=Strongyloides papillosus TaxID=174720 RepID=A0A0N5BR26_STREA